MKFCKDQDHDIVTVYPYGNFITHFCRRCDYKIITRINDDNTITVL